MRLVLQSLLTRDTLLVLDGVEDIFSNAGVVIYINARAHPMLMLIKPRIMIKKSIHQSDPMYLGAVAYKDLTQVRMLHE